MSNTRHDVNLSHTQIFLLYGDGSFAWANADVRQKRDETAETGEQVWNRCGPQDKDQIRDALAELMLNQKGEISTEVRNICGERLVLSMHRLPILQPAQHAVIGWIRRLSDDILQLTEREREVLKLICEELTTEQIAGQLNISTATVDSHRQNISRKLGTRSVVGQVRAAIRGGLIEA